MERTEPSLVPEWLKNSGNVTGSGTATRPLSPLASNSDDHAVSKLARNKSSVNNFDYDLGRSSASDRTSSSYFRRSSSSNGSTHSRSYGSFGRSQRGYRDWEKHGYESRDKDVRDQLDSLGNIYPSRFDKDGLRRSHSMISSKHGEGLPRKRYTDGTSPRNDAIEGNTTLYKVDSTSSTQKATFERDFPSLGSEDRQSTPEIGRVPSPVLGTNVHGLPTSAVTLGDKWVSALTEAPAAVGSSAIGGSGPQTSASGTSLVLNSTTALKMADAVAQGPQRAQLSPQLSSGTQRLEELVIKQSKQLIPVTPPMPKALVLSSSDKVKPKSGQQQLSTSSSLSAPLRGGPVKPDILKTGPSGKMIVLKTTREKNGTAPAAKDSLSPTKNTKAANSSFNVVSPVGGSSASRGSTNNPSSPSGDWKVASTVLEKKSSSQAQSRNDFFNLVRKKSMAASASVQDPDPGGDPASSSSPSFKAGEQDITAPPTSPEGRDVTSNGSPKRWDSTDRNGSLTCNCNSVDGDRFLENGRNHFSSTSSPSFSEEEEAAFLRSLGWVENADEDGLTEEEIDAFLNKHLNSKQFLKYRKD